MYLRSVLLLTLAASSLASAAGYVQSDAAHKTATVIVNAGEGNDNGGLNFDGSDHGKRSFTVPVGWTVRLQFKNVGMMPHSAIVTRGAKPPATISEKDAAFPGASTDKVVEGLAPGAPAQMVTFTAGRAGTYNIVCGVPGHGLGGQYLGFIVSPSAKAASYK